MPTSASGRLDHRHQRAALPQRRVPPAHPRQRRVAASIRSRPARPPCSRRSPSPPRRRLADPAALRPALRRRVLLPLLHRRLPQSGPPLVQRGRVWPAGEGRAAARVAALTSVESHRYFERTHAGARHPLPPRADRRGIAGAGALRSPRSGPEAPGQPAGELLYRRADPDLVRSRGRGARPAGPPGDPARLRRRGHRRAGLSGRQLDRRRGAPGRTPAGTPADPHGPHPGARSPQRAGARPHPGHHPAPHRAGLGAAQLVGPGHRVRRALLQLHAARHPARHRSARPGLHGAGGPRRGAGRSHQRRLHRGCPALRRHHRPGAAAGPREDPPSHRAPAGLPPHHRADRAARHAAGTGGPLSHRGGDAGRLRQRRGHLRDAGDRGAVRDRSRTRRTRRDGKSGSAGPWATTTSCSPCWAQEGSGGCTGSATCTSSARWRSRCSSRC